MSYHSILTCIQRTASVVEAWQRPGGHWRDAKIKIRAAVKEVRTAAWHLRQGGVDQLRLWNWKRVAARPSTGRAPRMSDAVLERDHKALQDAWREYALRARELTSASVTRGYRNLFAQGWVLTPGTAPHVPTAWIAAEFGVYKFLYDPDLAVEHRGSTNSEVELLLLGHAADSKRDFSNSRQVADFVYTVLQNHDTTFQALDEAVMWLGGRFLVIARLGSALCVHVDASAARSCYWGESEDLGAVLASHASLIGQMVGDESAENAKWVLNHPDYKNPAGVYLPGTITSCDRAQLVFANCRLDVIDGRGRHSRFFPRAGDQPIEHRSVESAAAEFLAEVRFQTASALAQTPRSVLALTAGSDSKAIVQATIDLLQEFETTAMTYHFFERNADHTKVDLLGANRLAEAVGLRHRILDLTPWNPDGNFAKLYNRTFPVWARFGALSKTVYEGLSAQESLIVGVGGEIGTAFYLIRDAKIIDAEVLAGKFTQTSFAENPRVVDEFARYMDYTQLSPERSGGYDLLDLFYWEHRLSSWAAYWYSELDFGPTVVLPLNSRRLYCAMLSVSFEDRVKKNIYSTIDAWASELKPGRLSRK